MAVWPTDCGWVEVGVWVLEPWVLLGGEGDPLLPLLLLLLLLPLLLPLLFVAPSARMSTRS